MVFVLGQLVREMAERRRRTRPDAFSTSLGGANRPRRGIPSTPERFAVNQSGFPAA